MKNKSRKTIIILLCTFIILLLPLGYSYGQMATNDRAVFWSSTRKLTVDDFGIKTKDMETVSSFAQFSVDYQVTGFDFMTKKIITTFSF